jgi:lipopolysaccharide transport system permease protein
VLILALIYGVGIDSTAYLAVAFLALGVLTAFALGTLFAAINVKYRDVAQVVPVFVQIMFFVSPILFPASLIGIKGNWTYLYALNPMASVLEGVRWSLFHTAYPGTGQIAVSVGSACVLFAIALAYFRRTELYFADIV